MSDLTVQLISKKSLLSSTDSISELNDKQKSLVLFHCDWCKKAVLALKEGKPVEPYHVFLSDPGSVGKSHVIKLLTH